MCEHADWCDGHHRTKSRMKDVRDALKEKDDEIAKLSQSLWDVYMRLYSVTGKFTNVEQDIWDIVTAYTNDVQALTPRDSVRDMTLLMEGKLRANDYKGGWGNEDPEWLFIHLVEEVGELGSLLRLPKTERRDRLIPSEAADICNMAMMVMEQATLLEAISK